jgi:hypothetical protein
MRFSSNSSVLGVPDGAKPLKVVIPSLLGSFMAQSNPVISDKNMLTLTLAPNVNLAGADQSVVTISGIRNAGAPQTVQLFPTATDANSSAMFAAGGISSRATFSAGTLQLAVAAGALLRAHSQYEVAFEVILERECGVVAGVSVLMAVFIHLHGHF